VARRGDRPADAARADVADLLTLALDRVDPRPLLPEALDLAQEHDVSVYDATYLVTARSLDIPLLTADARLARKVDGAPA